MSMCDTSRTVHILLFDSLSKLQGNDFDTALGDTICTGENSYFLKYIYAFRCFQDKLRLLSNQISGKI